MGKKNGLDGRGRKQEKARRKAEERKQRKEQKKKDASSKKDKKSKKVGKSRTGESPAPPRLHLSRHILSRLKDALWEYQVSKELEGQDDDSAVSSSDTESSRDENEFQGLNDMSDMDDALIFESSDSDDSVDSESMANESELEKHLLSRWTIIVNDLAWNPHDFQNFHNFFKNVFKIWNKNGEASGTKNSELLRVNAMETEAEKVRNGFKDSGDKLTILNESVWSIEIKAKQQFSNKDSNSTSATLELRIYFPENFPRQPPIFVASENNNLMSPMKLLALSLHLYSWSQSHDSNPTVVEACDQLKKHDIDTNDFHHDPMCFIDSSAEDYLIDPEGFETSSTESKSEENRLSEYIQSLNSVNNSRNESYSLNSPRFLQYTPLSIPNEKSTSIRIKENFEKLQKTPKYIGMQKARQELPAWKLRDSILSQINSNQVVVISGETGCGKSTQIPQYILDHHIISGTGARCNIVITQPRRISAMALAERVSQERSTPLGDSVGYSIRLENKAGKNTKLLYCTTGILLRRLESQNNEKDRFLSDLTHIVVDEVHERSIDSDFLLMVLRDLARERKDLKIVLMSATLNSNLFSNYFGSETPIIHIPGRTFPVEALFLENALAITGYTPEGKEYTRQRNSNAVSERRTPDLPKRDEDLQQDALSKRYPKMSKAVISSLMQIDSEKIQYPLLEALVLHYSAELLGKEKEKKKKKKKAPVKVEDSEKITNEEKPYRGILIFLPGYAEISTLYELLLANADIKRMTDNGKFCFALHSTLSSEEQRRVFLNPPPGSVKIILSTNVAETSITIDDVVIVLDTGKMKEVRFDATKGMVSLEECWVAQAHAVQRRGRAGRVSPGKCIHLFTSHKFENFLDPQQLPEMARSPLEQLCLRVKTLPFLKGKLEDILDRVIEPPSKESVKRAIKSLQALNALTDVEDLTPLGFHLSKLPVDVRIGKLIIFGCIFNCVDPILTMAAIMSTRTPFVAPFEKRDIAQEKRDSFNIGNSDHLTLLKAYNEWREVRKSGWGAEKAFLWENYMSSKTLTLIASVKRQLVELLSDIGFIPIRLTTRHIERHCSNRSDGIVEALKDTTMNDRSQDIELLKALLVAALYPNVIKIEKSFNTDKKSGKLITRDDEVVAIHPSSIHKRTSNFNAPFIVYLEKVKTSRVFVRDATAIGLLPMALFGGQLKQHKKNAEVLIIGDPWLQFRASPRVSIVLMATRMALDEILDQKIRDPNMNLGNLKLVDALVHAISSVLR